jgi:hypothetical protein
MQNVTQIERVQAGAVSEKGFAIDTTFVLFFLAVEFGQMLGNFSFETVIFAITLLMLLVLPYFLPSDEKQTFGSWLLGRSLIAGFAISVGAVFKQSLGVVLPETFRFLPMTLLIVTAMLSCYIQFYGFLKLRLAK